MDNPNTLKPNTLYFLQNNNKLLFYQTDSQSIPLDLVTGKRGPKPRSYKELDLRHAQFLAWQMQSEGEEMIIYGAALEKIVGTINQTPNDITSINEGSGIMMDNNQIHTGLPPIPKLVKRQPNP